MQESTEGNRTKLTHLEKSVMSEDMELLICSRIVKVIDINY